MSLKTVVFHGHLRELAPEGITVEASSVKEALEGVTHINSHFGKSLNNPRHTVAVVGFDTLESMLADTDADVIHVVPTYRGGKSAWYQVGIGALLVVVSVWNPAFLAAVPWFGAGGLAATLGTVGLTIALGGVASILSPAPTVDNSGGVQDPAASSLLGAQRNTTRSGTRIPIGVGRFKLYGQLLSFDIQSSDIVNDTPSTTYETIIS